MTDRTEDELRKLYVAAQVTAIVCDAERDAAEAVAEALCTESDFVERHGDRDGGCRRLAIATYESAREEVEVVLEEHGLSEYIDEIEGDTIWVLTHGYLGTLAEFVELEEPRAMAESIRHGVVDLAESLEESLQYTFDVTVWDPSDWEPSDEWEPNEEESAEEMARYRRLLAAAEDARRGVTTESSTGSPGQGATESPTASPRQGTTDNSFPAKVGRVVGGALRSIGGIFR